MEVDIGKVLGTSVVIGGIIFGYGQLTSKVESIQEYNDAEIRKLADDNMNDIIKLKTQMNLLVTPQMEIVPSPKVNNRLYNLEAFVKEEKIRKEERRQREFGNK